MSSRGNLVQEVTEEGLPLFLPGDLVPLRREAACERLLDILRLDNADTKKDLHQQQLEEHPI